MRVLQTSIHPTTFRNVTCFVALGAGILASAVQATSITWNGAGATWNDAAQWNPAQIPGTNDEAIFTDTLTSGKTISLGASQAASSLTISALNAFTLGTAGDVSNSYTLSLTNVTRSDVTGTENNQTIAAGVALAANSVWNISGSGYLNVTGVISGGYGLTKRGAGELRVGAIASYTGATVIEQGSLYVTAAGKLTSTSSITIGGYGQTAKLTQNLDNTIATTMTINSGGTFDQNGKVYAPVSITVAGGNWIGGQIYSANNQNITLKDGGQLSGTGYGLNTWGYNASVNSPASSTATSTWGVSMRLGTSAWNAPINVYDGAGYIDLIISGGISGGTITTQSLVKNQAGVLQLTSNSNTFDRPFNITGGTVLVDNTSATSSGTGARTVTVSAGATLGGAGYIGGGYSTSAVSLSNGSSSSRATIAPGSINNSTGDALIGTLTVGTAAQANNVTFGTYARLLAQVGNSGSNDRLSIYGNLNLSAANDLLALQTVAGSTLWGEYTIASFSGTLTGRFDSVTLNDGDLGTYQLQYRDSTNAVIAGTGSITGGGSIVLVVPEPSTVLIAIIGGAPVLLGRRRRVN